MSREIVRHQPESRNREDDKDEKQPRSYNGPKPTLGTQESLLAMLCFDEHGGRKVVDLVPLQMFEGDYLKVASEAMAYWGKYNQPPAAHLDEILITDSNDPETNTIYLRVIRALAELRRAPTFNPQYVLSTITGFIKKQRQKHLIIEAADELQHDHGDPEAEANKVAEILHKAADLTAATVTSETKLVPSTAFDLVKVRWYHTPFFPWSAVTLLGGDKGTYKSTLLIDIAANLSRRLARRTYYLTKEAGGPGFLRGLMETAGGKPDDLVFPGKEEMQDGKVVTVHAPPDRLDGKALIDLENKVKESKEAGRSISLIVIDPFDSFVDARKIKDTAGVRETLDPLNLLAERYRLMIVLTSHFNKTQGVRVRDRFNNSNAIVNGPRCIDICMPHPKVGGIYILVNLVSNFVIPGTANVQSFDVSNVRGTQLINWSDPAEKYHMSESEIDAIFVKPVGRPGKKDNAKSLLTEWLADGDVSVVELQKKAGEAGIGWRTLKDAKKACGVITSWQGRSAFWSIP